MEFLMKSASLGVLATLVAFCFIFTSSSTATNNVDVDSITGALSGTTSDLSLSGSILIAAIASNGGRVVNGATSAKFRPAAPNAALFSSTFPGPVTWTLVKLANQTHNYSLSGVAVGTMAGMVVDSVAVQRTINTATAFLENSTRGENTMFADGKMTSVSSVPEPSTLSLLLTGSVGTVGMMRRKRGDR